jgi:molybdate transport system regulatory protein
MMKYAAGTTAPELRLQWKRDRVCLEMGGMARSHLLTKAAGSRCSGSTRFRRCGPMPDTRLSIRLDLTSGARIGPGKIALLEAIQACGSISGAARALGMSYRRAWLLVEEINESLQEPAVTAATGGRQGGGAALTPSGERVIELYRSIEDIARSSAKEEFRAVGKLVRKGRARA